MLKFEMMTGAEFVVPEAAALRAEGYVISDRVEQT
jgi:hypothetical protein